MFLFRFSVKMRDSRIGKAIYDFLEFTGIRIIVSRFFNKKTVLKNYKKPNMQMAESKKFFLDNSDRVDSIEKLLNDEESKIIYRKMINFRCNSNYNELPNNSMRKQYFGNDFFQYTEKEVFVDCGAYDGDSIKKFKQCMRKNKIKNFKIVAFEPDSKNFKNLLRNHPDVVGIPCGVWDKCGSLQFMNGGEGNSTFIESGKSLKDSGDYKTENFVEVPVRTIDGIEACNCASFIKMDIEGAEYQALIGAEKTIKKNKPKLAICIYHSDLDMIRLAELIHSWVPEYKLCVRQHSNCICETVLYAFL